MFFWLYFKNILLVAFIMLCRVRNYKAMLKLVHPEGCQMKGL